MDISEEQGHSLTQPQSNYQRQELNIDQVRVQISPSVSLLSLKAIFFSVPAILAFSAASVYILSLKSFSM